MSMQSLMGGGGPGGGGMGGQPVSRDAQGEDIFAAFDKRIVRRFFGYVRPYRLLLVTALATVIAFVVTQVSIPLTIKAAVDSITGVSHAARLNLLAIGFLALIAVNALFSFLQEWLSARLAQRVIFDLRRSMFEHLQDVSLGFLDQTHVGRIMSRLQGDVNALQEFLEQSVSAIGDLVLLVGIIAVLLAMDLKLGLLTLAVLPVLVVVRALWLPRVKTIFREARDASSIVNGALAENIGGVRTVQASRREEVNFADFRDKAAHNLKSQISAAWAAQAIVPAVDILTGLAQAVVVVVGGYAVLGGRLDVGVMIAFVFYVQRFFDPIRTLSQQYTVMQRAMAAGYRIFEVLDVPVTIADKPDAITLDGESPAVAFRDVTFGYKPGQPVLHNISFDIAPGQVAALVGPTGSGKTSIMALAHRFYDVWSGQVLIGGHDVRDLSLDTLGRNIAMVLQEPFLFSGTIADNIGYNTGASREAIVAAAKAVRADAFIERLPAGYDTELSQRGQNLSLGQRQLISYARALVADPRILVLDEATASIDSFTEQDIQAALKVLMKGRTCILIAHRLATVRDADKIIVLKDGAVLQEGTHDGLIAAGGLYAELYRKSYSSFDELEPAVS